ncbi:FxsA family membrane protein [Streptomyces sp. ODS05-4]|uniref:FxsA family membrane protein n=1 Tax=Streptomyces sp. ODS05-4 TaxID=2944939 RepID=UPI00210CBB54|nr:FxsA family membrane protein [Streptomyces sp. ODS05-4]
MTTGAPPPAARKRSRVRSLVPLALAAWLVLEIWLLTLVAGATSGLVVFALLAGAVLIGGAVVKRAGRRAFGNLQETVRRQQSGQAPPPGRTGEGNGLLMLAGLLIALPGLVSDAAGLLLLIPPVRTAVARAAERSLDRRVRAAMPPSFGDAFQQAQRQARYGADGKVVQGEVVRDEPRPGAGDDTARPPLER